MAQFIAGKEVKATQYYERLGKSLVAVLYMDNTSENMAAGDFWRRVKRVKEESEKVRFDTEKSEAYETALKEGYVGLEAKSKQRGLGRWKR